MNFRPAVPDDSAFIVSGWSASLRISRDIPLIPMSDWASIMRPVIRRLLDRASCIVAETSVLCGFIAFEPNYCFYVYVAQPFRRHGLARGLFGAAGIDPASRFGYACRTLASWQCRSKIPLAQYDPFKARFAKEQDEQRNTRR